MEGYELVRDNNDYVDPKRYISKHEVFRRGNAYTSMVKRSRGGESWSIIFNKPPKVRVVAKKQKQEKNEKQNNYNPYLAGHLFILTYTAFVATCLFISSK